LKQGAESHGLLGWQKQMSLEARVGFESTSNMITKEFCGATWPSKELKRKERNSYCPLIAPKKSAVKRAQTIFFEKCFTPIFWSRFCPQTGDSFRVADHQEVGQTSQYKRV
jgi:hypothetical protein